MKRTTQIFICETPRDMPHFAVRSQPRCEYLLARSRRHPVADLPCGAKATSRDDGRYGPWLCRRHARVVARKLGHADGR